jgi:hypothetical protein
MLLGKAVSISINLTMVEPKKLVKLFNEKEKRKDEIDELLHGITQKMYEEIDMTEFIKEYKIDIVKFEIKDERLLIFFGIPNISKNGIMDYNFITDNKGNNKTNKLTEEQQDFIIKNKTLVDGLLDPFVQMVFNDYQYSNQRKFEETYNYYKKKVSIFQDPYKQKTDYVEIDTGQYLCLKGFPFMTVYLFQRLTSKLKGQTPNKKLSVTYDFVPMYVNLTGKNKNKKLSLLRIDVKLF